MRVRVQVVIEPDDGGPAAVHEVAELERGALQIDTLGLQLAEAKELLRQKAVGEFGGYIRANAAWIPNYGERYRHGEAISNAFVESTVNQVVSKRMVKKQQMRWTPRGAHLLLQVRTRVLSVDSPAVEANPATLPLLTSSALRLPHFVPLSVAAGRAGTRPAIERRGIEIER